MWPAIGSNEGWHNGSSGSYSGRNSFVAPGALLAIPQSVAAAVKVTTGIGSRLKQAFLDYGAYLVDGTGHGPFGGPLHNNSVAICMDALVNAEMRQHLGFNMAYPHGISAPGADPNSTVAEDQLYKDLLRIFRALHAVTNNGPRSVGGGGTPRVPTKPPICGTADDVVEASRFLPTKNTPRISH